MCGKELLSEHLASTFHAWPGTTGQSGLVRSLFVDDTMTSVWNVPMGHGITRQSWLSLSLEEDALSVFEAGNLRTIEAAGSRIVGVPKRGVGHHLLGTLSSREEAAVVATILRLFNPN